MQQTQLMNQFLIAMPSLADPNFAQTVTYVFQHDEEGAIGLMVNKALNIDMGEVLLHLDIKNTKPEIASIPVLMGGPVQRDRGFVMHKPVGAWKSTLHVNNGFAITTSRDILEAIAENDGPRNLVVALGYAGWGPGQLEREISENAWLSVPSDPDLIFNTPLEQRWEKATALLGIDLKSLSHQAGHA